MDSPCFPAYVLPNLEITFNYTGIGGREGGRRFGVTHFLLRCLTKKLKNAIINPLNLNMKELKMAEAKGLNKPVKLKNELAEFLGATELPRTEITKKLWDYIKANKLQTKTENGKPENAGKFIVADAKLLPIFKNTKSTSKSGTVTDLTNLKEGQTINMMQMAAVVAANIE
jgi:chromatin remodeling complex protein RSC6